MRKIVFTVLAALALTIGVATATAGNGHGNGGNSANAKACQKKGWKNLLRSDGSTFKNQGACVSYAAHGGTLVAKSQAQIDCESFAGTFTLAGTFSLGTAVWSCQWANTGQTDFDAKATTLSADCLAQPPTGLVFYDNDGATAVVPGSNKSVCSPA
jgi:hypothetical protein